MFSNSGAIGLSPQLVMHNTKLNNLSLFFELVTIDLESLL